MTLRSLRQEAAIERRENAAIELAGAANQALRTASQLLHPRDAEESEWLREHNRRNRHAA